MALEIPLLVRPLASTVELAAQVPEAALTDYFGALGARLRFAPGKAIADDPTDHPEEVDAFCRSQEPTPAGTLPWPGVIVVGEMSVDGPGTNGILLDLDHRGACAIFTQSFGFDRGSQDDRFEIYAHEIGHMLNLSHAEAADKFPTAMNQWDVRSAVGDRGAVWRKATTQGSPLQKSLLPAFFGNGTRSPLGLPMSARCCDWLTAQGSQSLLPWGDRFKDPSGDGAQDASFGLVTCRLVIQTPSGSLAQPVDFQVQISALSDDEGLDLPAALDLRSGLIELHVTPPYGNSRRYRTKSRTCGTTRQRLQKGKLIRRNYSLIGDVNGVLFPTPGMYTLEAVLPSLGARSGPVEFYVGPAAGPFDQARFQTFLAKDLPTSDEAGWRWVEEALASRAVPALTKGFLRSKAFARGRMPLTAVHNLRREASPRIQERDSLLRVVRLRRRPLTAIGELEQAIDEAEQVLRDTDETNPSIQYLEYVRRTAADQRGKERR